MYVYYLLDITGCTVTGNEFDNNIQISSGYKVIIDGTDDKEFVEETYEKMKKEHPKRTFFIGKQRVWNCYETDL